MLQFLKQCTEMRDGGASNVEMVKYAFGAQESQWAMNMNFYDALGLLKIFNFQKSDGMKSFDDLVCFDFSKIKIPNDDHMVGAFSALCSAATFLKRSKFRISKKEEYFERQMNLLNELIYEPMTTNVSIQTKDSPPARNNLWNSYELLHRSNTEKIQNILEKSFFYSQNAPFCSQALATVKEHFFQQINAGDLLLRYVPQKGSSESLLRYDIPVILQMHYNGNFMPVQNVLQKPQSVQIIDYAAKVSKGNDVDHWNLKNILFLFTSEYVDRMERAYAIVSRDEIKTECYSWIVSEVVRALIPKCKSFQKFEATLERFLKFHKNNPVKHRLLSSFKFKQFMQRKDPPMNIRFPSMDTRTGGRIFQKMLQKNP